MGRCNPLSADRDLVVVSGAQIELDPSSNNGISAKWGSHATKPLATEPMEFKRIHVKGVEDVDLKQALQDDPKGSVCADHRRLRRRYLGEIVMSTAREIAHGAFGRVALLGYGLVASAPRHPHCHVLSQGRRRGHPVSSSGDKVYPLTNETAVLVNAGSRIPMSPPGTAAHRHPGTLYRTGMVMAFRPGWAASGRARLIQRSFRRSFAAHPWLAMNLAADMMPAPKRASRMKLCCRT